MAGESADLDGYRPRVELDLVSVPERRASGLFHLAYSVYNSSTLMMSESGGEAGDLRIRCTFNDDLERVNGFEPSTLCLASTRSTN